MEAELGWGMQGEFIYLDQAGKPLHWRERNNVDEFEHCSFLTIVIV